MEPRWGVRHRVHGPDQHQLLPAAHLSDTPLAAGRTAGIEQFLFVPFDSLPYAIHIVGYSLMSVQRRAKSCTLVSNLKRGY